MLTNIYHCGISSNTPPALYPSGITRYISRMKGIDDIRRDNLRHILQTQYAGKQAALAAALDKQANVVSRVLGSGRADQRNIGTEWARQIEQRLHLPDNWLDNVHAAEAAMPHQATDPTLDPRAREVLRDLAIMIANHFLLDPDLDLLHHTARHIARLRSEHANPVDTADGVDPQTVLDEAKGKASTTAPATRRPSRPPA